MTIEDLTSLAREVRQAGLLERYYITRHHLRMFSCVVVSAKYVGADAAVLDGSKLFPALAEVVEKHGALRVRLEEETSGKPVYVHLDKIDLSQVVEFLDHEPLEAVLEAEMVRRFDTSAALPLWRLKVLPDNTLTFAWHHGIGDGQSGFAFHHAFLSALNKIDRPLVPDLPVLSLSQIQGTTLIPCVEQLADLSVSPLTIFREIFHLLCPTSWTPLHSAWTGSPVPAIDTFPAKLRTLRYTPSETAQILGLCRTHGSTLTAVLHTLSVLIISESLAADPATSGKFKCLSSSIPVSLRRLTGTSAYEMCNEASRYHSYPPLMTLPQGHTSWIHEFPWHVASQLTSTLRKQQKEAAEHVGILKFLFGNYEGYFKGMLGKKRNFTLQISNLGHFPSIAEDVVGGASSQTAGSPEWAIEDMFFTQCLPASGAAIAVNVTGTPAGGLGMSVSWGNDAIDDSKGELFFRNFKEAIAEMLDYSIEPGSS